MNKLDQKCVAHLLEEKRYADLVYLFRALWDKAAWQDLKRNQKAVGRIKQEFARLTNRPAFPNPSRRWDEQIAKYVARLGVAALIDDMKQAVVKRPQSMVYFLFSAAGACRWENLVMADINKRLEEDKKTHDEAYAAMAELLDCAERPSSRMAPKWVDNARIRLEVLRKTLERETDPEHVADAKREKARIEFNLEKWEKGYKF